MKIIIQETIGSLVEVENKTTEIVVAPFDVAADAVMKSTYQAKGDLIAGTGAGTYARVPAASGDGKVLKSDSTQTNGVTWGDGGGDVSVSLTNQSGSSVANGDVVVFDSGNDSAFTTTTNPNDLRVFGVAGESINAAALGKIKCIAGSLVTVNCDSGAVNRGEWLVSSATIKLAKSAGYFNCPGAFAIAVTSKAGGSNGTVQAILVQGFSQGVGGTTGWQLGGITTVEVNNAQKLTMVTGTWATIAGAALPVSRGNNGGIANANIAGYSGGGGLSAAEVNAIYKLSFATETSAAITAVFSATRREASHGANCNANQGYFVGGKVGSTGYSNVFEKIIYATDTRISGTYPTALTNPNMVSDGSVYMYAMGGGNGTTGQRLVIATDTFSLYTDANPSSTILAAGMNFPATAGYRVATSYGQKIPFATGVITNCNTPVGNHLNIGGVVDGLGIGYVSGHSTSPYSNSDKFTRATETFAADSASALASGKYASAYFNNGAI